MSVSFFYVPVGGEKVFSHGTSNDHASLEKVFGSLPREFGEENVSTLRAMAAAQDTKDSLFEEIADKIEEVGAIRVDAQY